MTQFLLCNLLLLCILGLPLFAEICVLSAVVPNLERAEDSQALVSDTFDWLSRMHETAAERAGFFTHRARADEYIDYQQCRRAYYLFGLQQFNYPEEIVAAFMRNEQCFYLFGDDCQDQYVNNCPDDLETVGPISSIGPGQLQLHNILRLILSNNADGTPVHPPLMHLRKRSLRAVLEPDSSALLVAAFLTEESSRLADLGVAINVETLAYATNPDVFHPSDNNHVFISPDLIDRHLLKLIGRRCLPVRLESLTQQNCREVLSISRHVKHIKQQIETVRAFSNRDCLARIEDSMLPIRFR